MAVDTQPPKPRADEPVFNTFKRKPLRPFYSLREFQIGMLLLGVLALVVVWVIKRGANPDPSVFSVSDSLLANKGKENPIYERPFEPWVEPGSATPVATAGSSRLDPFPPATIGEGWRATGAPQMFDESNLYEKIDGREAFYKSYGFKKLHFLSLASTETATLSIDIELFDLSSIQNALGAMIAELSNPDAKVEITGQGLSYTTRNGGFVAQGRYYARMLGSDDNDAIRKKIVTVRDAFLASLPSEPLPWAYDLFIRGLQASPSQIQYYAENAFSFAFAKDVYAATLPGGDTEVFLSRRTDPEEAKKMATEFAKGFAEYGKPVTGGPKDTALFKNEYVNAIEGARVQGNYVIGVRMAKSAEEAGQLLNRLAAQLEKISSGTQK